ncbi:hypothetical protein [Flavobacterium phage FCL-2]|uniref:Uncharacterized protein n=1 Tax=Flavobacterium phage FCL-2 TaxID=908819 RepID=A0A0F7NG51_9CAUD|nr:hypothetical protein ABG42_gp13 [Flavobacterium phage FCL-2]AKH87447.1 hypothetical protein [Flavobacterium phage FCL-2]
MDNNDFWVNIIRGLGVFVVAYFTEKKFGISPSIVGNRPNDR